LLATESVMGKGTLTQAQAWQAYDRWRKSGAEPNSLPSRSTGNCSDEHRRAEFELPESILTQEGHRTGVSRREHLNDV